MPKIFTDVVREALIAVGWEIYPGPESMIIDEWWWIPTMHKDYWRNPTTGLKSDNFMPLKDAINWQLMLDRLTQ